MSRQKHRKVARIVPYLKEISMSDTKKSYSLKEGKLVINYASMFCDTSAQLLKSELFTDVVARFIQRLASKGNPLYESLEKAFPNKSDESLTEAVVGLFRLLEGHTVEEVRRIKDEYDSALSDSEMVNEIRKELYNYWRRLERILYLETSGVSEGFKKTDINQMRIIRACESLKQLVLNTNRRIGENITGRTHRVYRQLPAGSSMGMLLKKIDWKSPDYLSPLKKIPFVRLTVIEPPLIIYTKANTRSGTFKESDKFPKEFIGKMKTDEWYCLPIKVGSLTCLVYFHQDFGSMALSLANLFKIADLEDVKDKTPDIVLIFGTEDGLFEGETMFYDDNDSGIMIGLVKHLDSVDYFGYFKKMILTLNNVRMIKTGRLPVHGAMVTLLLKNGGKANVVLMGDSGAGKSETIEALRNLAEEHISDIKIIFDDMGSLAVGSGGEVLGYGTEIGAFVRLDDLEPGYAYEEIDRSIFMNPHKKNARVIIPITAYRHIVKGYPVDFFLYANNYDYAERPGSLIELLDDKEKAIDIFRSGARFAKGTTDEKGLVHTYFANPFGAPQRREEHEVVAEKLFNAMYKTGVKVGQIRTRLGVEGFGQEGPRTASIELFEVIKKHCEAL